jgi:hypothetical protein
MQISVASIETRGRQFYKVMGNAFSTCSGSSAFSSWEAVSSINVIIWNKELLMGFEMCL